MTENFNRLVTLLRELFQMDRPDLDFGIYRIMNQKRKDVSAFLENDLLPQVRQELSKVNSGGNVQAELDAAIKQLHELGVDPESSPKVKALREKVASTVNTTSLENEIYSHLYNFFRRYYKDGDFLSLRRYKKDVYAIPYEGEEVKLHWANADQYYIKSAENFRDYAFLVGEAPTEGQEDTRKRVHFKLVDADTEVANNKAQEGKERRFMLCDDTPMLEEDGELIIRFEYKPTAKKQNQKSLNEAAVRTILGNAAFVGWVRLLAQEDNGRSCLEKHLNIYTARNTFDYFIHKDLGGFLRRELDFYIKNEVLFLDDIESQTAAHVEGQLTQIRVLRRIAHKIIRFLEQIENFQKKLWLKKKFVVETNYIITLDLVPEELYPEVAANDAQREEWVRIFAIDETKKELMKTGYSTPITVEFLKSNKSLVLDTQLFNTDFKSKIIEYIDNFDKKCNGLLIHSENFQSLSLLQKKYKGKIQCIYIDPPYNTDGDGFCYKDRYRSSSWCSLIKDRIDLCRNLLKREGTITSAIGREELLHLLELMDETFGIENRIADLVWEKGRKNDAKFFSLGHDYMIVYGKDWEYLKEINTSWRENKPGAAEILSEYVKLKKQFGSSYKKIEEGIRLFYKSLPANHPALKHKRYNRVDRNGIWRDDNISWPGGNGPRYDVIHPDTKMPCKVPDRGWCFANKEKFDLYLKNEFIEFREDHTSPPLLKRYLNYVSTDFDPESRKIKIDSEEETNVQVMPSVFYKGQQPTVVSLRNILGGDFFKNPKEPAVIARLFKYMGGAKDTYLDFFAGSGSTGHSIIDLNRIDNGQRKFILIEMGDHFETVIKPRIKKIIYSNSWKDGKPTTRHTGVSHCCKYLRLESYEDTLNNLALKRTPAQLSLLTDASSLKEEYMLSYMMDLEAEGSASLLNTEGFSDPWNYTLKIATGSAGETKARPVDLVETFNYLLGLNVIRRNVIRGIEVIEGTSPEGEKVLVIWRNTTKVSNVQLDEFFRKQEFNPRDTEFDLIYVNGDNNLENLKRADETWKVRLTEEEFKRLMFDVEDV